jgi:hypothetical protein
VYAVERPCCRDLLSLSPRSADLSPSFVRACSRVPEGWRGRARRGHLFSSSSSSSCGGRGRGRGRSTWWSVATLLMSRAVVEPILISWVRPGARGARAAPGASERAVSPRSYLFSTRACVEYTSHSLNYVASESAANQEVRATWGRERPRKRPVATFPVAGYRFPSRFFLHAVKSETMRRPVRATVHVSSTCLGRAIIHATGLSRRRRSFSRGLAPGHSATARSQF